MKVEQDRFGNYTFRVEKEFLDTNSLGDIRTSQWKGYDPNKRKLTNEDVSTTWNRRTQARLTTRESVDKKYVKVTFDSTGAKDAQKFFDSYIAWLDSQTKGE